MQSLNKGGVGALRRPLNPFREHDSLRSLDKGMRSGSARFMLTAAIVLAGVFGVSGGSAHAATVKVTSAVQLQAAVSSAQAGDTIGLAAGNYAPDSTLDVKVSLTIVGPDTAAPTGNLPGPIISGANITKSDPPDILVVESGATLTLKNVSVSLADNFATAIKVFGTLDLDSSDVTENDSTAAAIGEPGSTLHIQNSTIGDNNGAGIEVYGGATATFLNVTIADNDVSGLFNDTDSSTSLTNTLLADNGTGNQPSADCYAPVTSSTDSLDTDSSCGTSLHGNALIGQIKPNGGPTATAALQAGSPAIGAGLVSACPALDQRGAPRGGCDIGAYAFGTTVPTTAPGPSSGSSAGGGSAGSSPADNPGGAGTAGHGSSKPSPGGTSSGGAVKTATSWGTTLSRKSPPLVLTAEGAIRRGAELARFEVRGTHGKHTGLVAFTDRVAGVRLRSTTISRLSFGNGRRNATVRGTGMNLKTGRRVRFTIVLTHASRDRFRIALSSGYDSNGILVSGRVSIKE